MIKTSEYKLYAAVNEQGHTDNTEIDDYDKAHMFFTYKVPDIHTPCERCFGNMEELAKGNVKAGEFAYQGGKLVRISGNTTSLGPVVRVAPTKNYAGGMYNAV